MATGVGRYVTLDGIDPIQSTYTNGQLPTCTAPCPIAPGTSFPHIRDGSYRAWSIFRVITDTSGSNLTNAQALVTAAQNGVNSTVPDFVPFGPTPDGDPGLQTLQDHRRDGHVINQQRRGHPSLHHRCDRDWEHGFSRPDIKPVCYRADGNSVRSDSDGLQWHLQSPDKFRHSHHIQRSYDPFDGRDGTRDSVGQRGWR